MSRNGKIHLIALALITASSIVRAAPLPAQTATNPRSMIKLHTEGRAGPPATLADVAWLEGRWIGEMPEGPVEHVILGPSFGHLPGFVRAVNPQGVIFYEIWVLAEVGGSLTIRVKHFSPQLAGWEAQDAYIDRPLVDRDADSLFFDGATYARTGPDSFTVYFLNRSGGEERETIVIPFRRMVADGRPARSN
jgi:hypothetical protein